MMKKTRKKKRAYLAGQMRGCPEYNFPAFHEATERLRAMNWEVFSPAERDLEDGFNPLKDKAKDLSYYMAIDLPEVCKSDVVVVLLGWGKSQGARLEVYVACELGKQILDAETLNPVRF